MSQVSKMTAHITATYVKVIDFTSVPHIQQRWFQ